MKVFNTINEVREYRKSCSEVGFVPTMGALHAGHASLIAASAKQCKDTLVSIFVNPSQFGPNEDLGNYPRTLDADIEVCKTSGADAIFVPTVREMYPNKQVVWVDVDGMTDVLCGASRPRHFRGVMTIVCKLFNIVQPARAYFGQKDAQQVLVIKRMVQDLNLPTEIVTCPIIREPDGLAMSSRNVYLSDSERVQALAISKSLVAVRAAFVAGERNVRELSRILQDVLKPAVDKIDYAEFRDAETLDEVSEIADQTLVAIAAIVGKTRLIDNIVI